MPELPGIQDAVGPLDSAYVVWDLGGIDASIPEHAPFIPPLANRRVPQTRCNPHPVRFTAPASLEQLLMFFQGGGIRNTCTDDGVCNGSEPRERPGGAAVSSRGPNGPSLQERTHHEARHRRHPALQAR